MGQARCQSQRACVFEKYIEKMAKISLCLIVGNVEDYIARCLNSFLPIADEVCIVRAIGNQTPDRTLEIAEETIRSALLIHNRIGALTLPYENELYDHQTAHTIRLKFSEYKNAAGHEDWPHVDNFAAARQMSFDLATGDYCFWCDSDDILKSGAATIRQLADRGGFSCYIFPYDIFGKNVIVNRERMMLRDSGRWQYAVHEAFKFKLDPPVAALDDSVVIQHLPRLDKGERERARGGVSGNQRNLRILESLPPDQLTPGLKYHLFGELICAGRKEEAIELGVRLVTGDELGKDERYDLLMSLYLQTPSLKERVDLAHEAHKTDPERREALGVLACTMMDMGRPAAALAYARQMAGTVAPEEQSWNSRQNFYGYVGDDIYQQALRVNRRFADAEKVRQLALKKYGGARIALLHATRGRAEQAAKCRKAWHDLASQPGRVEHIFAIDDDDKESFILRRFNHCLVPAGGGCVRAWNYAAWHTTAPIVVQLSDDWTPLPQWDDLIYDRLVAGGDPLAELAKPKVLAISDGHRTDSLLCMAICTRNYLCVDYFLFHPFFTGVFSDNWFTLEAYGRGLVTEARDLVFKHNHPIFDDRASWDDTYARQNAPERYAEGEAMLARLRAGNDWSSVHGFFNFIHFYEGIAARLQDGDTVAEIGVWLGRSIIFLAQLLQRQGKPNCKLIAVDTFTGEKDQPEHYAEVQKHGGNIRAAFEENCRRCGVRDMIRVIEGDSAWSAAQVADASLAFCFIDAAHDYESVRRDIAAWKPKLKPGAPLAGHDIQHDDVQRAVTECLPGAQQLAPIWVTTL